MHYLSIWVLFGYQVLIACSLVLLYGLFKALQTWAHRKTNFSNQKSKTRTLSGFMPNYPSAIPGEIPDDPKLLRKRRLEILQYALYDLQDLGYAMNRLPVKPGHKINQYISTLRDIIIALQQYQATNPKLIHSPEMDNYLDYLLLLMLDPSVHHYIQPFNSSINYEMITNMLKYSTLDNLPPIKDLIKKRYLSTMENVNTSYLKEEPELLKKRRLEKEKLNSPEDTDCLDDPFWMNP